MCVVQIGVRGNYYYQLDCKFNALHFIIEVFSCKTSDKRDIFKKEYFYICNFGRAVNNSKSLSCEKNCISFLFLEIRLLLLCYERFSPIVVAIQAKNKSRRYLISSTPCPAKWGNEKLISPNFTLFIFQLRCFPCKLTKKGNILKKTFLIVFQHFRPKSTVFRGK